MAFETAHGFERRNDGTAAAAGRSLLAQLDRARDAGWSWADIDATLRQVHPSCPLTGMSSRLPDGE